MITGRNVQIKNRGLIIGSLKFTPLEIMPRCSAAGSHFNEVPAGFNAPLEFLTGFTWTRQDGFCLKWISSHFDHGIGNLPSQCYRIDGGEPGQVLESG